MVGVGTGSRSSCFGAVAVVVAVGSDTTGLRMLLWIVVVGFGIGIGASVRDACGGGVSVVVLM